MKDMKHQIEETIEENEETASRGISKQKLMVLIPLAVILLIIIFCIIKVIMWNNGTDYHFEGQKNPADLESESEDYFVAMEKSLTEGHEDNGQLDILFLGDDLLTYGDSRSSIVNQVADATGANVYNCAFPGSSMACKNVEFSDAYCNDLFSFIMLATYLYADDFSLLDYYKTSADIYDSSFDATIDTLKGIDLNDIDIVFLCYGTHDYLNGMKTTEIADPTARDSMTGALTLGISVLRELYPHIRFVVMSPTFCYYDEGDGTLTQGDIRRVGETDETLGGYIVALKASCVENNLSFLDNYFGIPLHAETAQEYMVDAIHVNDKCRTLIADKVIDFIENRLYWQ